jgi:hypothetical protein
LAERVRELEQEKKASSSRVSEQDDLIKNLEARLLSLELGEKKRAGGKSEKMKYEGKYTVPGDWETKSQGYR